MRKLLFIPLIFLSACSPWWLLISPPTLDIYSGYNSMYVVRIESDTYYNGYVGNQQIQGGSSTLSYPIYPGTCWMVRKQTMMGMVRTYVTYSNYYPGGSFPKLQDHATTSPYGSTSGCL